MSNELVKNLGELNGSVKSYVQAKIDLAKLSILEKTTRLATYLINFQVVVMFLIMALGFGAAAFAVWYGQTYNNYFEGLLIAGSSLIVICLVFVVLRKRIITASVIRNFSEILFTDEEKRS